MAVLKLLFERYDEEPDFQADLAELFSQNEALLKGLVEETNARFEHRLERLVPSVDKAWRAHRDRMPAHIRQYLDGLEAQTSRRQIDRQYLLPEEERTLIVWESISGYRFGQERPHKVNLSYLRVRSRLLPQVAAWLKGQAPTSDSRMAFSNETRQFAERTGLSRIEGWEQILALSLLMAALHPRPFGPRLRDAPLWPKSPTPEPIIVRIEVTWFPALESIVTAASRARTDAISALTTASKSGFPEGWKQGDRPHGLQEQVDWLFQRLYRKKSVADVADAVNRDATTVVRATSRLAKAANISLPRANPK